MSGDKKEYTIVGSVLCCVVYDNDTHTQYTLNTYTVLEFAYWFRFQFRSLSVSLDISVVMLVAFVVLCHEIG